MPKARARLPALECRAVASVCVTGKLDMTLPLLAALVTAYTRDPSLDAEDEELLLVAAVWLLLDDDDL